MKNIPAFAATRIRRLRVALQNLETKICPNETAIVYETFCDSFPLLSKEIKKDFFYNSFNPEKDYYIENTFARWIRISAMGLFDIERALRRERASKKRLFYPDQFKTLCLDQTVEGQEAALNEMVVGSRMSETGLNVFFRDRSQAGSDLIWINKDENREVHLEIITPQYSGPERKRLKAEIAKNRIEREAAIKSGEKSAMTMHTVSPFGWIDIADQVERIKDLKSSKNQVAGGDSGVQIVVWTLGLNNEFFEPIFFDRNFLNSGFIYHAYYGKWKTPLFKMGSVVEMFTEQHKGHSIEQTKSDGRFVRKQESKFSAAIFVDPTEAKGVFLRNFNSKKPLSRNEIIALVEALDAARPPSRWLDMHEPNIILGTQIHGV